MALDIIQHNILIDNIQARACASETDARKAVALIILIMMIIIIIIIIHT